MNEIVKGKLYQRGRFRDFTMAQKRAMLHDLQITDVVNLWGIVDDQLEGVAQHIWPGLQSDAFPPEYWDWVDGGLVPLLKAGHVLLVHCEAGHGRSVATCAALLTHMYGYNGEKALEIMRERVQGYNVNRKLRAALISRYYPTSPSVAGSHQAGLRSDSEQSSSRSVP